MNGDEISIYATVWFNDQPFTVLSVYRDKTDLTNSKRLMVLLVPTGFGFPKWFVCTSILNVHKIKLDLWQRDKLTNSQRNG